ncbi:unnamed protein product, partial [Penicillium nalgiovense]
SCCAALFSYFFFFFIFSLMHFPLCFFFFFFFFFFFWFSFHSLLSVSCQEYFLSSLALTSMRARRWFLSLFTSSVSILDAGISILLLDGYSSTLMVYCLLEQIQIWVGCVAFALCSDDCFISYVVVLWCIRSG